MSLQNLKSVLVAVTACACGAAPSSDEVAASPVPQPLHAISVLDGAGETQTLLIAGVRGPDFNHAAEAAAEAQSILDGLLAEGGITHSVIADADRYDRIPSQIILPDGRNLATTLIEAGWVMVWPRLGQDLAYATLYDGESLARKTGAGAWGQGGFAVRDTDPNRLAPFLDSAQIIEGRVIAIGSARDGRVFLNFGLDWRTDFTAVADEEAVERFAAAGLDLSALEGTVIRVRGWMFELNGPSITLSHPAQVELVDAPPVPALPR